MNRPSAYAVYLILSGASTLFNAIMFTVQAVYYVQAAGLNPLQLVLVGTAMEIAAFLFEVPTGLVADTYSRRLSVIIGTVVTGAAFVLQGLVPRFDAILLGLVIWGIGATFLSGAREAWIADEVGEDRVGQVFLRTAQVRQVAALAGTFVSVGLASIRLDLPLVVGGGLTVALGVWLIPFMPERGFRPAPRGARSSWQTLGATLREGVALIRRSPVLPSILGASLFFGAFSESVDRLGQAHFLANFAFPSLGAFAPVVWFGIIEAGARLLSLAAAELFARRLDLADRVALPRALLAINALLVASLIGFGLAGSFALALGAYWAIAVARALNAPLYGAWLNQHINPRVRATVLSLSGQADALGQFTGGPAIGAIGAAFSLRAAMVAAGLILSPVLLLFGRVLRRGRPAPPAVEEQPAMPDP